MKNIASNSNPLTILASKIAENLLPFIFIVKTKQKLLFSLYFAFILFSLVIVILIPNKFMATATILPSSNANPLGQYASIASMVGFDLPVGQENNALYPDIILSERILLKLASQKWSYCESDSQITLYDLFDIIPSDNSRFPEIEKQKILLKILREEVIFVDIDKKTNIVTLSVKLDKDPKLCAEIANYLLHELDIFNNFSRKSKSSEEKDFLENRLSEVMAEMASAENKLKVFEESEKNWRNSASLRLTWQRLNRDVQVSTTIWIELRKQYELVKLNVLREKTTIEVLDTASVPAMKYFPRRSLLMIGLAFFHIFLAIFIVLSWDGISLFLRQVFFPKMK